MRTVNVVALGPLADGHAELALVSGAKLRQVGCGQPRSECALTERRRLEGESDPADRQALANGDDLAWSMCIPVSERRGRSGNAIAAGRGSGHSRGS
jgi:hypothetical protein